MLGLSSRFLAKWLPLALRIFIAASLWLLVAPLLTAYLYHGWMHRPSSVLTRWKRELIPSDIVSGAIVAAIIIISFLSLMSFADFLRVHWQQQADRLGEENGEQQRRNDMANGFGDDDNINNEIEGGVDEAIVEHIEQHLPLLDQDQAGQNYQRENPLQEDAQFEPEDRDSERDDADRLRLETQATRGHELAMLREARRHNEAVEQEENDDIDEDIDDEDIAGDANGGMEGQLPLIGHEDYDSGGESDDDDLPAPIFARGDFFRDEDENIIIMDDEDEIDQNNEPDFPPLNDGGDRPFDPMDPVLQDDQVVGSNSCLYQLCIMRLSPSTY
jgi:E3 ubiquitin-protein ligase MARCH6